MNRFFNLLNWFLPCNKRRGVEDFTMNVVNPAFDIAIEINLDIDAIGKNPVNETNQSDENNQTNETNQSDENNQTNEKSQASTSGKIAKKPIYIDYEEFNPRIYYVNGQTHMLFKNGKLLKNYKIGPPCFCYKHCLFKITQEQRKKNYYDFWKKNGTWLSKIEMMSRLIKVLEDDSDTIVGTESRAYVYHLMAGDKKVKICKKMFMSTFAIQPSYLQLLQRDLPIAE